MKCALIAVISGVDTSIHRSSIDLFWRLNCCQSAIFRLQWTRRQTLTFSPYVGEYIFSYIGEITPSGRISPVCWKMPSLLLTQFKNHSLFTDQTVSFEFKGSSRPRIMLYLKWNVMHLRMTFAFAELSQIRLGCTGCRPNLGKYHISPMRTFWLLTVIFLRANF